MKRQIFLGSLLVVAVILSFLILPQFFNEKDDPTIRLSDLTKFGTGDVKFGTRDDFRRIMQIFSNASAKLYEQNDR